MDSVGFLPPPAGEGRSRSDRAGAARQYTADLSLARPTAPTRSPLHSDPPPRAGEGENSRMRETAQNFEASFLAQMLKPMFEGLSTDGPFGGGEAEGTWRSFMIDAMAKQTVKAGGIGLADTVVAEMVRMQARQSAVPPVGAPE